MLKSVVSQKHPNALYVLVFAEFWDRFSYYGVQSLLVLYLTHKLLFSDNTAYGLYGVFTALSFASAILGGLAADKLIGYRYSMLTGGVFIILGNLLLAFGTKNTLFAGLATLCCGVGLFKPNCTSLVGTLYDQMKASRNAGFSIFYMGMNAGGLLGPILYGYIAIRLGWHAGFIVSALGTGIGLLLFIISKSFHADRSSTTQKVTSATTQISFLIGSFFLILIFGLLIASSHQFGDLLSIIALATVIGLISISLKSSATERNHIIGLSIISFFSIFYFACSLQTATTLMLFVDRNVDKMIFGIQLPSMAFLSIQPFFIILLAPFIGKLWSWLENKEINYSTTTKVAFGLLLAATSFFIFAVAARLPNHSSMQLVSVILGNVGLALGELCTLPIVLSAISQYSPIKWRSTMMGILFLSLAYSGYFAGIIAKITSSSHTISHGHVNIVNYAAVFTEIGISAIVISIVIFVLMPWVERLFGELPSTRDQTL